MKHISKERREVSQLRETIRLLLAEQEGWRGYEAQRLWLRKLRQRGEDDPYTERERDAVERMIYARTFFDGWAGYSVQELVREARRYMADFAYEDEVFLKEIERATRLVRGEMGALVGLCRTAGMDILRFGQKVEEYQDEVRCLSSV